MFQPDTPPAPRGAPAPLALFVGGAIGFTLGLVAPDSGRLLAPVGRAFVDALRVVAPLTLLTIVPLALSALQWGDAGRTMRAAAWRALGLSLVAALVGTVAGVLLPLPVSPPASVIRSPWQAFGRSLDDLTLLAIAAVLPLTWSLRRAAARAWTSLWPRRLQQAARGTQRLVDLLLWFAPAGVGALAAGLAASAPAAVAAALARVAAMVWFAQGVVALWLLAVARLSGVHLRALLARSRDALITAVVTGSSAATLPIEWRAAVAALGISPRTAALVIPAGSLVSKAGTTAFLGALGAATLRWSGVPVDGGTLIGCVGGALVLGAVTPPVNGGGLIMLGLLAGRLGADPGLAPVLIAVPFIGKLNTPLNVLGRLAIASVLTERSGHPPHAAGEGAVAC